MRNLICIILVALSIPTVIVAQGYYEAPESKFEKFTRLLGPEKLFVHTDKDRYCVGDTIWIKAYLANASQRADYSTCNYIYVELVGKERMSERAKTAPFKVVERVKLKKIRGHFFGYIVIPENLFSGIATLRAYSYWMLNKGENSFFYKDIQVVSWAYEQKEDKKEHDLTTDIQFLPESGRYHPDEISYFGIRAIGSDGRGKKMEGLIYADTSRIARFSTDQYGFGKCSLSIPESAQSVYAVSQDGVRYSLQMPEKDVVVINAEIDSSYNYRIRVHGKMAQKTWILAYDKTRVLQKIRCPFKDTTVVIPFRQLSPGVNRIAVVDDSSAVLAERTIFAFDLNPIDSHFELVLDTLVGYRLNIDLRNLNGMAASGQYSLSAVDAPDYFSTNSSSIESYIYLESEFEDRIENARRFFKKNRPLNIRMREIDMVMLTYGWEYYNLSQILNYTTPMPSYGKEYAQSLSGRLSGTLGRREKRTEVTILAPTIYFASFDKMDTLGRFVKNALDFPENTGFIICTTNMFGLAARMPVMNPEYFPDIKNMKHNSFLDTVSLPLLSNRVLMLKPSQITATATRIYKGLSPFGDEHNFKTYQIRDKKQFEKFADYDVPDYVAIAFPRVRLHQSPYGTEVLTRVPFRSSGMGINSGWSPVKIYIDKMPANYQDLNTLRMGDIDAIALLADMDSYQFIEDFNTPRGVLMVKTKSSKKLPTNVAVVSPLGWQKPVKRYVPKYRPSADYVVTDGTICWEPNLSLNNGRAEIVISPTSSKEVFIRLEGLSTYGQPVSIEKSIYLE